MRRFAVILLFACALPLAAHSTDTGLNLALPVDAQCSLVNQAQTAGDRKTLNIYREFVKQLYLLSNSKTPFDPSEKKVIQTLAGVVLAYCRVFPHESIRALIIANETLVKMQVMEYSAGL